MDSLHHHASMANQSPMQHGHDGHDMPMPDMPMCSMNMIFNWQIENVCVVFESWHIYTWVGMLVSCFVIFSIAAGYEYLRAWTANLDREVTLADVKRQRDSVGNNVSSSGRNGESDTLLGHHLETSSLRKRHRVIRSVMYAILMGISFWLMLVFMTYNGYLMIAIILGAGVGHYIFGQGNLPAARSISCH
ncbi:Ctr copper transporter family-domain-containing protein [Halteromyces radiatus]|uniref:Ctr copper transporter family-domain-containing protein n=1 Tax=Halteromyces radiatus TaxID=101107 RepID=UPI00221E9E32|nr:Ctr copper transporter family-domain-containing protein [Halteromyces radiatus]KAI8077825.1 Ctr copper transporter family-domain-containing protein [Halteromyces radiatus]